MYAERELKRLSEVKVRVRRRIARRREEVTAQTERVTQPLQWVDRAYVFWKKAGPIAKLAAAPIGVWLTNKLFGRRKMAGSLMRWAPMLWNVARGFGLGSPRRSAD
jgi:hypothetical protein